MNKNTIAFTIFVLVLWLLPTTAAAQFVPIGEVASLGTVAQQGELQQVLDALARKSDTTRKKAIITLGQLEDKSIGASNARRQIEGEVGSLKVAFNKILADYSRQTPQTASLREAYQVAQTYLNDIRAMTDDAASQATLEKKLDPSAPTGKYLAHQKKVQSHTTAAVAKADARLTERGKKVTVLRDLEQIVQDTQRQINLATASYLLENADVLESVLQRINTKALEDLSAAMESRFKEASTRSSDQENDLNTEEDGIFQGVKQELSDTVDRAISTFDLLVKQVLSANLPSASQEPGVNPLLEAKFKTQKQMADILQTSLDRINKINGRTGQNADYSALLKEVIAKETTRQKQRLTDTHKEYEGNFIAGDPTRQQYTKRKRAAQEKAEGCTSFLCDIGRVVSGVGSAFISGATGGLVNIPPQTFSGGLFGIQDPTYAASPYSSSYLNGAPSLPFVNGQYTTMGAYGGQNISINPQCIMFRGQDSQLSFLGVAQAQGGAEESQSSGDQGQARGTGSSSVDTERSTTRTNQNRGFFGELFGGNLGRAFGGFSQTLRNGACGTYQNQYSMGTNSYYGGLPVMQAMGLPANAQLNLPQNYVPVLSQLFQSLGQRDPRLAQLLPIFDDGQLTGNESAQLQPYLQQIGFFSSATNSPFWQDPIRGLVLGACHQAFQQSNQLALQICKQQFTGDRLLNTTGRTNSVPSTVSGANDQSALTKVQAIVTNRIQTLSAAGPFQCQSATNIVQDVDAIRFAYRTVQSETVKSQVTNLWHGMLRQFEVTCPNVSVIQLYSPGYSQ